MDKKQETSVGAIVYKIKNNLKLFLLVYSEAFVIGLSGYYLSLSFHSIEMKMMTLFMLEMYQHMKMVVLMILFIELKMEM